jgi:FkbM family methyltransferase
MQKKYINWQYKQGDHFREDSIKEYIDNLSPGVFFDLGANLGWFSLHAANLGHDVYAFEVDDHNFFGMEENIKANPEIKNIKAFKKGIADKKMKTVLRSSNTEIGTTHKTLELENFCALDSIISYKYTKEVEVDSLDNIISNEGLPFPDYLKIDIDGSEYAFLIGSPEVLQRCKSMVIEMCPNANYFEESITILKKNGFKMTKLYPIPGWDDGFNLVFEKI